MNMEVSAHNILELLENTIDEISSLSCLAGSHLASLDRAPRCPRTNISRLRSVTTIKTSRCTFGDIYIHLHRL